MGINKFYVLTSIVILLVLGYLTYHILQPFFTAISWAIVFCVVFYPVYAFALKYIRFKTAASFLTLILIVIVIIGPFSYISFAIVNEIRNFIGGVEAGDIETVKRVLSDKRINDIAEKIQHYVGLKGATVQDIILENAKKFGAGIIDNLSTGFTNLLGLAANIIIMLFTTFFLLKDGPGFFQRIRDYLPFTEDQKDRLTIQIKDMIVSTIYGGVIVAILQGILGGLAFAILDLNSPVLWGSVMAIVSFIPMFGTAIVWMPASLILLLEGAYMKGIGLILIGVFVISMADNILKPLIIGGRTKMPTVVIFFTVLGGIKFFGLLGFIMGPLVLAMFVSVLTIFRSIEGGSNAQP